MGAGSDSTSVAEGVGALELSPKMNIPQLPVELLVIIAEHLIGMFAFGTTANLNVSCQSVYTETLPVLYETFFVTEARALPHYRTTKVLPKHMRYVKYLFCKTRGHRAREQYPQYRNAVLLVTVDESRRLDPSDSAGTCHIAVYKPVSIATALTILNTPVIQPVRDHTACTLAVKMNALVRGGSSSLALTRSLGQRQCADDASRPIVRPSDALLSIRLEGHGHLHGNSPLRLLPVSTDIVLWNSEFENNNWTRSKCLERRLTTIELLKIAGMQRTKNRLLEREQRLVHEADWGVTGRLFCIFRGVYCPWHLETILSLEAANSFVNHFRDAIEEVPEIVHFRFALAVTDITHPSQLRDLLSRFQALYASKITSTRHILPADQASPEIFTCVATWIGLIPLASEIEKASKNTPCSGSLRAVTKGNTISIAMELHG